MSDPNAPGGGIPPARAPGEVENAAHPTSPPPKPAAPPAQPSAAAPAPAKAAPSPEAASKPPAPPKDAPPPRAPDPRESLELAFAALLDAPGTLAKLAARPVPGFGSSLFLVLLFGAAFLAVNVAQVAAGSPALFATLASPPLLAAAGVAGLGLWTSFALLASALLFASGRALGRGGDFTRAWQLVALAAAVAPFQAALNWTPAWFAPTLLGGWIAACGLAAFFEVPAWPARALCAAAACALLSGQWGARAAVSRASAAAAAAVEVREAARELTEAARTLEVEGLVPPDGAAPDAAAVPAPGGASGLDLLRMPAAEKRAPAKPDQAQELMRRGEELERAATKMMDSVAPLLDDPRFVASLPASERKTLAELKKIIAQAKKDFAEGKPMTPEEQQKKMAEAERMFMKMVMASQAEDAAKPRRRSP